MAEALQTRAPPPDPSDDPKIEVAALRRQVAALTAQKETVAELERELDEAKQATARLRAASALRIDLGTIRPERADGFLKGEAFREGSATDLAIVLGKNRNRIKEEGINRLTFEIDVAPGIGRKGGAGTDPEYDQSLSVARALIRRLRATTIPFSCVVPLPFGKTRASPLVDLGRGANSGDPLTAFEELGNGPVELSESQAALARAAATENRIVVLAERIPAVPCETDQLLRGIDDWLAKALP